MFSRAQTKPQPGRCDDGHAAERRRCVFVVPAAEIPCGVEAFTRELVNSLQVADTAHQYEILLMSGAWRELGAIARAMRRANVIVFSFPLIAWKRVIALPCCVLLIAFAARKQVIVFLHEWASMNVLRRVVLFPFVALGDVIITLTPFVRDGLAHDPWVRWARSKCRLALHAPPIERPPDRVPSELARQLDSRKERGDLLIGYFGALYTGKGPVGLLEVCDYLRAHGVRATVAFIGGFPKSLDRFEDEFRHQIEERNLQKNVIITGHIRDNGRLFALLERMDVFLYLFPEGLTTRRSSVLTSVGSGRPVVVNAPSNSNELAHHPGYASLVKSGAIVLLPSDARTAEVAQRILEVATAQSTDRSNIDFREWWRDSAQSVADIVFPAS